MKKYILFLSTLLVTISLNGMLVKVGQRLQPKINRMPQKRTLSFVPSTRYPGYLVCLNRECTKKELEEALYIKIQDPRHKQNCITIKLDNFTEKEKAFASNPAYIGLPNSGAVWGPDCSPEKSSFFGAENDAGYFPIVLFKETDTVAWPFGMIPKKLSLEETKKIVVAENPKLKEQYPFLFDSFDKE